MPYAIKKVPNGYKVYNRNTGKVYSHHPLSLNTAYKQLKVMNKYTDEAELHGAGFFDYIKNVFSTKDSGPVDKLVKNFGDFIIRGFEIYRTPVDSKIGKLLNVISFGKYKKELENSPYDKLFHLFIAFKCELLGKTIYFMTEKSPTIVVKMWDGYKTDIEDKVHVELPDNTFTIRKMFETAKSNMGSNYNTYEAVSNNCQVYVSNLLHAININEFDEWITQNVEKIVTGHTRTISKVVTSLGHFVNRLAGGQRVHVHEKLDGYHVIDYNKGKYYNDRPLSKQQAERLCEQVRNYLIRF